MYLLVQKICFLAISLYFSAACKPTRSRVSLNVPDQTNIDRPKAPQVQEPKNQVSASQFSEEAPTRSPIVQQTPSRPISTPKPAKKKERLSHVVTFVRHAESCQNRRQDCNGNASENQFTQNGKWQAYQVSNYLTQLHRQKPFTQILSSEMWRTGATINDFINNQQSKPKLSKDSRLNECEGGEVGCYSGINLSVSFANYLQSLINSSRVSQHILIVGHSRRGYDLMKTVMLKNNFWKVKEDSMNAYLKNCYKEGRWWSCQEKANAKVIHREYSHIHNAAPIRFNMISNR